MAKRPQGHARGKRLSESHKNQIAAAVLMQRLRDNAQGKLVDNKGEPFAMTATQIKSAELFLSKTVPSLSSVEQTVHEEQSTPDQLMAQLTAMLDDPATRQMLRNMLKGYQDTTQDNNIEPMHKSA